MKKRASRLPLFEVRHSPVHGYGVFALRRIRKGTTVTEYLGERISHAEADARYEDKDPDDNHTFLFTVDSKTVIDGGVGGNDARYINHGCEPNCESTTQNKRIYVEALRTIQPGEELAYDYQIERDPEDPPNVDEIFACRCASANCRGSMLVARKKPRKKVAARPASKKRVKRAKKKPLSTDARSVGRPARSTAGAGTSRGARRAAAGREARQAQSGRPRSAAAAQRAQAMRRGAAR
ncbi:MAG: SET domain-containing protein-lysine N-methyltransferase [Pseudomonadota bacterium]|nr:SET domain-containing protein-lysine N-methyltransferase [Pseudomonadota bacterium]